MVRAIACSSFVFRKALWPTAPLLPGSPEDVAAWLAARRAKQAKPSVQKTGDARDAAIEAACGK